MTEPTPAASASTPATAPAGTDFPGKTLGIVGVILAIVAPLIGLILSIVANSQSKAAGYRNGPAKAGIIVAIVLMVLGLVIGVVIAIVAAAGAGSLIEACAQYGPGTHTLDDGRTLTCS